MEKGRLRTVEEIMVSIHDYPHIPDTLTLAETIIILKRWELKLSDGRGSVPRCALVFNEDLMFTGIVRRRDIMRGLEPDFLRNDASRVGRSLFRIKVDVNVSELSHDKIVSAMKKRAERRVKEVMRPIETTVEHDEHLVKAMTQLTTCDIAALPVMKDGKVVGVLRSVDVLHELAVLLDINWEK